MPHSSQAAIPGDVISGCMGHIQMPSRFASTTLPLEVSSASTVAETNMSGLSRPSVFSTFKRTLTVRVRSSNTGSMKATRP